MQPILLENVLNHIEVILSHEMGVYALCTI